MTYSEIPVDKFGGLNLTDDPADVGWGGAIDLLNVEFTPGRIGTRPGYTMLSTGNTWRQLYSWRTSDPDQIIAIRSGTQVDAINVSTGAITATKTWGAANYTSLNVQPYGIPTAAGVQNYKLYLAGGLQPMQEWSGAAFADVAGAPRSTLVGLLPAENRLVAANIYDSGTTVQDIDKIQFSDPGAPGTWGANNYLRLRPGVSGQGAAQPHNGINALVNWRENLFVFKRDAIFVFYGSSTDSSGNPIFNYRTIDHSQIGCTSYMGVASSPNGVYFISSDGIYLTSGNTPTKVSGALDPLFRGQGANLSYFTPGSGYTIASRNVDESLAWWQGKLFYTRWGDAAQTTRVTFVYDELTQTWTYWDLPIYGSPCSVHGTIIDVDQGYLLAALKTGGIAKIDWATRATSDNGTAITARYRSGFSDLGRASEKTIGATDLWGTGTVNYALSKDFGSLSATSSVAMGTSPAIARGMNSDQNLTGTFFSWQVSAASGAWSLNRIVPKVAGLRPPSTKAP